jgi:hypothetical protein
LSATAPHQVWFIEVLIDDDRLRRERAEDVLVTYPCGYDTRKRRITGLDDAQRHQYHQVQVIQWMLCAWEIARTVWRMPFYRRAQGQRRALQARQMRLPSHFTNSEVAAMIKGVLRHCTTLEVDRQYVDSHRQSPVAFAFCQLLGFELLPRLKAIHKQRLYRPEAGYPEAHPHLQPALRRPINWNLIAPEYDNMVKYAMALRLGTSETEAILRRLTWENVQHPTYKALAEPRYLPPYPPAPDSVMASTPLAPTSSALAPHSPAVLPVSEHMKPEEESRPRCQGKDATRMLPRGYE